MAADPRASAYLKTQVQSRTPIELVVMLYDGALRFMGDARDAMTRGDLVAKRAAMSKSLAIVGELHSALNMKDGGEFAQRMSDLYGYINHRLIDANMKGDAAPIEEAIRLMAPLRDAWVQVATAPQVTVAR
ncbi:MAG TPA: flagellar export chaperone FliS [Vicinamibacterales bacterium]|nr:flagellar export chaperone FliS [Vicinamibacterales bacterium]